MGFVMWEKVVDQFLKHLIRKGELQVTYPAGTILQASWRFA